MKEIENLIEASVKCISKSKEYFNKEQGELLVAITAARATLKRAVVIEDNHFLPESLEKVVSFCHVKPLNALEGKRVRIIVIPEVDNGE